MKGLLKFIPAALAIVTFASCSSDDLFGNGQGSNQNVLQVTVEQLDGMSTTRAVRTWQGSVLNFQEGDQIRVYDNDLFKYDLYSFSGSAFVRESSTSNISTTKFAAFPAEDVKRGYWTDDNTVKLEMNIPSTITYDESKEDLIGTEIGYASDLPMWGTAAADGSGAKAELYHLTGVLAIKVTNMLQNVNYLIIYSPTQPISGTFMATLNADDPTSVQLGEGGDDLITSNFITIDLTSVPSSTSVIYVPILAGVSDLQVWASDDATFGGDEKVADYNSTYTFQRNRFKSLTTDFGIGSETPQQLTDLLDAYKNTLEENLTLDLENFYVGGAASDGSTVIGVPATEVDTISVNFGDAFGTYGNDGSTLVIQDADSDDPFTGTFVLNVNDNLTSSTPITIDLPEANVVLAGDFTNTATFNFLAAKSLTIGDGTTTTTVSASSYAFDNGVDDGVEEFTVAGKATFTTASAIAFPQYTKTININGAYVGDIDFFDNYSLFELNIKGTSSAAAQVNGNVWSVGNVNVALTKEGEAITGTLYMAGAEKTLALTQGYIANIVNCVTVFGSWQKPINTIKLDNDGQGVAAFNTLTDAAAGAYIHGTDNCVASTTEWTGSIWNGKTITNSTYNAAFTTYTDNEGTATTNAIFTASQLSSKDVDAASILMTDIDLNSKAWTGNDISAALDGNEKTISNLSLAKNVSNGLFATVSGGSVTDLTISGVSMVTNTAATSKVGAFAGQNTGAFTATNVAIKDIAIAGSSSKALTSVGGFIGDAAANLTLTKVTVAGSIDGYNALGGFVGSVSTASTLTFDAACASTVTFNQTYSSGKAMDITYAKIGGFVGTFSVASGTLTINGAAAPATLNHDKSNLEYASDTSKEDGDFYIYVPAQTYLGYCGATQLSNCTLPTFTLNNAKGSTLVTTYVESYFYNGAKKVGNTSYGTKEKAVYTFAAKE